MISINRAARSGALALVLATTLSACDSFLDVNTDPNNPTHVRMEQTLPAVLAVFHRSILDGNPTEWSTQWLQQWSYNRDNYGYSQIQLYELTSIDTDAFWGDLYADVGQETVNIMAETEKTGDWAYHGIAKFIHAWTMTIATDMYGPIPFTEAFDPLNPDPAYDSEKVVYDAAHEMIAEAIDEMQRPSARVPGDNDLLFGGDMDRWVQLARSVQARLHLRLVKAPGENATARAQAALDALAGGITEDATFDYLGGADARSPMYGYRADDWDSSTTISKTFVDLLRGLDDPRLAVLARPAEYDGVIRGHVPGQPRNTTGDAFFDEGERPDAPGVAFNDSIISKLSNVITEDTVDYVWFSVAELKFIEAEARLILSGAAAADAPYRAGIRADMERLDIADATIDAYLAGLPSLTAEANPLEAIITQKYIANFLHLEPYNDYRRTGYPVLQIVDAPYVPGIPQRLRTPAGEINYNNDNVTATQIDQGLNGLLHKVWWAAK
jgi:hypothetical protein